MYGALHGVVFWGLLVMQVLGVFSVVFARLCERSQAQNCCQRLFFVSAILLGAGTLFALALGSGWWISSGTTLSLMGLGATLDFSKEHSPLA